MSRGLAIVQISLGLVGLLVCAGMYFRFAPPLRRSLSQLTEFTKLTQTEIEHTIEVSLEGEQLLGSFQSAAEANLVAMQQCSQSLDEICRNLNSWHEQLSELSQTAQEASRVADNFAQILPFELPVITYKLERLRYAIPTITLKEQTVALPYPTAKLGSKKESIDLGVTKIDLTVPTLDLSTAEKKLTVPANPDVTVENREFEVPKDFKIDNKQLLVQEKQVLQRVSQDLRVASTNLKATSGAVDRIEDLVNEELRQSLSASESAMKLSIDQLEKLKSIRIPEFRTKLQQQHRELEQSQAEIGQLSQVVPWLFGLFSLIPIGLIIQGLWMWFKTMDPRSI